MRINDLDYSCELGESNINVINTHERYCGQKKIALLTYKNFDDDYGKSHYGSIERCNLTLDDNKLKKFLQENNIICEPLSWDNHYEKMLNFDMLIIRSTWNYYYSFINLNKFIEFIKIVPTCIYNPKKAILWNYHKKYLLDLKLSGINIVPTHYTTNKCSNLYYYIYNFLKKIDHIILKPCISGAARNTFLIKNDSHVEENINNIMRYYHENNIKDIMVQPFIEEIFEFGETSLIFFKDRYSHAVQKIPDLKNVFFHRKIKTMKFVPVEALKIAKETLLKAYAIIDLLPGSFLYARVDLLYNSKEGFMVSELELIEPDLFLSYKEEGIQEFGYAIIKTINECN